MPRTANRSTPSGRGPNLANVNVRLDNIRATNIKLAQQAARLDLLSRCTRYMRLQYPAGASETLKGAMKSAYDAVYPAT